MQSSEAGAVVRDWNDEDGWGVLDSDATPGGCWTHYSALDMDGYASAKPGQKAVLVYERANQDGYDWRAVRVRLDGVPARTVPATPSIGPSSAYGSSLEITLD